MGFFRSILKIPGCLVGLGLTLGGVAGFIWGLIKSIEGEVGGGIAIMILGAVAIWLGGILGKFARGDYDQ
jgi:hypothetical protein